ncbi:hypothetical protein SAMN06295905_0459 [Devosia lucknowensis]|uniref:Uncharacterized protein n=1 Tax=Devosia lucknowensis TaxID=1096929 RepID=A0A1Y6EJ76_9HYPH|nr:hypothetical protein [Devosia lucknowensis]SMQ61010.1 hypothetical protein SAMN06295905_0459 [Devosia lucknowensis]
MAGAVALVTMAALLAGCVARPVGDFGRAQPGVLHDQVMPYAGDLIATSRKEPVSNLNQTDQEREMHDRTWRFLVAPHSRDWMFDSSVELQRTRIGRARDHQFTTERYYNWLRTTTYQSSTTRYSTVGRHILADVDTVPKTFQSICAVLEVDRQRRVALAELGSIEQSVADNVAARRTENQWHIDWFVRALNYRYDSYAYALDHLLVETPHEQSMAVDENLRRLKAWVDRANRGDFCSGGAGGGAGGGVTIPSRFQTMVYDREVVPQK